ncbi:hypothetical protein KVR01_003374 [Diaporthe batatas]|uniref:uncharacterized protein n=1 Tax=Diaporthe batatas TaxID=748121 RepID=UPI001D03A610|nr:uncharacterized protein KVR01_003374 [Diaporthe batatas]KAG8167685.1 hypothetical protein KVR01_003374 [Diaporthe batatas]
MTSPTLLQRLRELSAVDCDTLDSEVARRMGPFCDCTSNQAIAFAELTRTGAGGELVHEQLVKSSLRDAHWMLAQQSGATLEELAVEFCMVRLALAIAPDLTGFSHVQTNPRWSYDTQKTIKNAERIVSMFKHLAPTYDTKRVCVKIPATWEGLQACRELEKRGIATLATTMFSMAQAALAAAVNCTYIAPYVNELRVHFDKGYVDQNKAFDFCVAAQRYYQKIGARTKVLPASLTTIDEVLALAGVDHITISPPLLAQLSNTSCEHYEGDIGSVMRATGDSVHEDFAPILADESAWRLAFTRSGRGTSEGKIIQAINIFYEMQVELEAMIKKLNTI